MTLVSLLVLSATAVVALGLLWLLRQLVTTTADEHAALHWWHFPIAALLLTASSVLIVYLTWSSPPGPLDRAREPSVDCPQ
jgi:hypothetical protein